MLMLLRFVLVGLLAVAAGQPAASAAGKAEHVVVVIWDGLRPDCISAEHTPTLQQLARDGVTFKHHHAVFCTSTAVNGSALATGLCPGHNGIIGNREFRPDLNPLAAIDAPSPAIVQESDRLTGGRHLLSPTVAEMLQADGKRTAIAGTKPVTLLLDRHPRPAETASVIVYNGKTLPESTLSGVERLLGRFPPGPVDRSTPNDPRDTWTTRALIESLWSNDVPAFSVLWLSEPDYSQHAAGLGSAQASAALQSSDRKLARVLAHLDRLNKRHKTDVFLVSDHGFSSVERSVDVAKAVRAGGFRAEREFQTPPQPGDIVVVGHGGSVLFYITGRDASVARRLVGFLQQQDFSGAIFTREPVDGAFTLDEAQIQSPHAPDVVLSMRWSAGTNQHGFPGLLVGDGGRNPGGGMHGSLSRFDLGNTLVAAGPDLKRDFVNTFPSGNIDLAPTVLWLLGVAPRRPMDGRVLSEALTAPDAPPVGKPKTETLRKAVTWNKSGWSQYLQITRVDGTVYLDEANAEITPVK